MKPRIVYGVHGYGRGHATRARAVLPALTERYEVLVLAGDEAYRFLKDDYRCVRIPVLRFVSRPDGRRSTWRTIRRNAPAMLDLAWGGPVTGFVQGVLEDFAPEAVVSDSEPWTHRAARELGLRRVSFDHYGILLHCRLPIPWTDRLALRFESRIYRFIVPPSHREIVAAFFGGEPRHDRVTVVGPILRPEVLEIEPTAGDHLLVYFQPRTVKILERVVDVLRALPVRARIYGPGKTGVEGNLEFRPIGNRPFLEDLASCRAVVSTAGNQLISEAIHYGKPLFLFPEEALEQRLNAHFVKAWGIGDWTTPARLRSGALEVFLGRVDGYAARIPERRRDGVAEAVDALIEGIESARR
jgi:uncharacterized protein (TIGR00661 family)